MLSIFPIALAISTFFSDWGLSYTGFSRPIVSFGDMTAILFILVWIRYKIRKKDRHLGKSAIKVMMIMTGLLTVATIGAVFHVHHIEWMEHFKSALRLIFWGCFMVGWIDMIREKEIIIGTEIADKTRKMYLNMAMLVAMLALFQFIFFHFTQFHLQLHPFLEQRWGSIGYHYRAMSIYVEPSYLGVILLPPLISQGEVYLRWNKMSDFIPYTVLTIGLAVSFSLASFLVYGIWIGTVFVRWLKNGWLLLKRPRSDRKSIYHSLLAGTFIGLMVLVLLFWIKPIVSYRVEEETSLVLSSLEKEQNNAPRSTGMANNSQLSSETENNSGLSSGIRRFSSYVGFWAVLKHAPIFGVGFDQKEYIRALAGEYFEATTSGIFGFIGTSAGLLGVLLIFFLFYFVWQKEDREISRESLSSKTPAQSVLLISGKTMILVLLLEHLFLYGVILNADFWLPLALAFLFINVKQGNRFEKLTGFKHEGKDANNHH